MKTVYLHIGNFKTGTTAIQRFCHTNREKLEQKGVRYLLSARPVGAGVSHSALPLSLLKKHDEFTPLWYTQDRSFNELCLDIRDEISRSKVDKILISSEEFFRFPSLSEPKKVLVREEISNLFKGYNIRVIMYVREPMSFCKSWYNQVNKSPLPCGRFSDFVFYLAPALVDPRFNAQFWRELFGSDSLIIRPYTSNPENHLRSFWQAVGIEMECQLPDNNRKANPGRDERTLETDRLAKVWSMKPDERRLVFMRGNALRSPQNIQAFKEKIEAINIAFDNFCQQELIEDLRSVLTLESVIAHEELINRRDAPPPSLYKKLKYAALNRASAQSLKNIIKSWRVR
ncbi:hypothetical protein [Haliea sp. E17]|uniref:hypothetical protein n=1 Tax=Haliea sp. E17 TaxID=3401576 RepID=UPI003AAEF614